MRKGGLMQQKKTKIEVTVGEIYGRMYSLCYPVHDLPGKKENNTVSSGM
jgi:hypothetical protein